ncbi:uncharacterized protein BYT42DRAFT_46655 [Radiomyces spectabilis]|uniref:uncharacterized protein n=1 Tax=Radiomyces spectabilis TaxID=64574 RepID=UPI00221FB6CD|nr:uncharacterized protein BYT42DRAFT_46655 [Radiomyces spectabilis]KAI8372804.1 hypothetical protein BYT42DRAFT_46655 [Radiomyces spectabilis]
MHTTRRSNTVPTSLGNKIAPEDSQKTRFLPIPEHLLPGVRALLPKIDDLLNQEQQSDENVSEAAQYFRQHLSSWIVACTNATLAKKSSPLPTRSQTSRWGSILRRKNKHIVPLQIAAITNKPENISDCQYLDRSTESILEHGVSTGSHSVSSSPESVKPPRRNISGIIFSLGNKVRNIIKRIPSNPQHRNLLGNHDTSPSPHPSHTTVPETSQVDSTFSSARPAKTLADGTVNPQMSRSEQVLFLGTNHDRLSNNGFSVVQQDASYPYEGTRSVSDVSDSATPESIETTSDYPLEDIDLDDEGPYYPNALNLRTEFDTGIVYTLPLWKPNHAEKSFLDAPQIPAQNKRVKFSKTETHLAHENSVPYIKKNMGRKEPAVEENQFHPRSISLTPLSPLWESQLDTEQQRYENASFVLKSVAEAIHGLIFESHTQGFFKSDPAFTAHPCLCDDDPDTSSLLYNYLPTTHWEEIYDQMAYIIECSSTSVEHAIIMLIYIERMLTTSQQHICDANWRYILLAGMLVTVKVWDDCAVYNSDFLNMYPEMDRDLM